MGPPLPPQPEIRELGRSPPSFSLPQAHQLPSPVPSCPPNTTWQPRPSSPQPTQKPEGSGRMHLTFLLPSLVPHHLQDKSPSLGCHRAHLAPHSLVIVSPPLPLDTHRGNLWEGLDFAVISPPPDASRMFLQLISSPSLSRSHGSAPGSWSEGGDMGLP